MRRLVLELEAGEPIRGWLAVPNGPRRRFAGLLELVAALDHLRGDGALGEADDECSENPRL